MEAIGVLAGGIAHDFNNMLMVIRGYSASLMRQIKEPELRKHAEQIDQAAVHAADFTRQLLAYSRQQALTPQLIDLNDVVGRMLRLLTRMMGEDITITTDFSPDVHPVRLDRGQIEQALLNIAANARDAMPDGGEFSVHTSEVVLDDGYARLHEEIEPGPHVLLEISDTGVGMDVDTQRRVFDPYFSTKPHGTGLGLATVYGIVRQSGGHIWLYSEPGIGSTFKLYFPAIDAVPVMLDDSPPTPGTVGGDETILVVEDDDGVRPVVAAALRSGGYLVLEASSGQRALNLIDQIDIPIDLLLTDVVMPEMNGRELASRVVARVPGVKVIFTSGYPADESVRRGIADATAEFLEKPYSPVDLARKVRAVLDTPRTPEEERPAER
jgi:CheY-like chemotaxis protein